MDRGARVRRFVLCLQFPSSTQDTKDKANYNLCNSFLFLFLSLSFFSFSSLSFFSFFFVKFQFINQGYSYGSIIAMPAVTKINEVVGFIGIACPFSVCWALTLFNTSYYLQNMESNKPKLFIIGTHDNFTSIGNFNRYVSGFKDPKDVEIIEGIDHFFYKQELKLFQLVESWLLTHNLSTSNL